WKSTLQQARNFIEVDMRPDAPPRLLVVPGNRDDREEENNKFSCGQTESPGVLRCHLACCVDFGEGKTLRFATLHFHRDQFCHYNIAFPLAVYQNIAEATKKKYGKPTKSEESTVTNLRGDRFANIVEQWKLENTLIVLGSRGGEEKIFLSYIDVYYTPVCWQI